jgi:hypothetical protein
MSIVNLAGDVNDAVEPIVVAAGEEYKIRIIGCDSKMNKNDEPYMLPRFEVSDEPLAKEFTKYLPLPFQGMDEKKTNNAKLGLKRLFDAFSFEPSGDFDTEDLVGLEGWAILGIEKNDQYGDGNFVKRFVAGN